jgi:heme/copper-type cytochrome/quinol oxidase subunit 1
MTITETEPAADVAGTDAPEGEFGDLASVVGSGDHVRIGRLFLGGSLIGLVASLVVGLLVDIERISATEVDVLDADVLTQLLSAHRFGLVLLFALPALIGLALVVVPLQVGASTVAFGRAANMAFWTWALGAALWIAGYLVGGGPGGSDLRGTDLWLLATMVVIGALCLAAVCIVTTVLALRTTGMTLARVPLFSFSMLVAGSIWILTLPVALGNILLIYVDHRYGQVLFGVNEAIVPQLAWLVGQPQVYVIAIPLLGIVGDVVPVFAGARQRMYAVTMGAIGVFGALSVGAWAQFGMPGLPIDESDVLGIADDPLYVGMGVLAVLPVLVVLGLGADTLRAGKPRLAAPLIGALLTGLLLLLATVAGALYVIEPLELAGTTARLGQLVLTVGAVMVGVVTALWYWATKVVGRRLADGIGGILALVLFVGALVSGAAYVAAGFLDEVDSISVVVADAPDGVEALNVVATIGTGILLLGAVGIGIGLLGRRDDEVPNDPWGGHTLEWATASPPARGNFAEPPEVSDERPLFTDPSEEDEPA